MSDILLFTIVGILTVDLLSSVIKRHKKEASRKVREKIREQTGEVFCCDCQFCSPASLGLRFSKCKRTSKEIEDFDYRVTSIKKAQKTVQEYCCVERVSESQGACGETGVHFVPKGF